MQITDLGAEGLSQAIHARSVSCREVMAAYLARIEALNPRFNAIVNLATPETLLRQAETCDAELRPGRGRHGSRGWMHGMPQAVKDTANAVGFPTTFGSPLLKTAMPESDSVYVERMKAAGAIVIGKTNMPEFGLGSHTYNPVFGPTPNAWDPQRTAGGSSGGAAVALAQRLLPVADGSDFMGSLRNPAGWNHIFGLRPSAGRVPGFPKPELFVGQLSTDGPMGRSVRDLAALLTTQAGHDPRAPLSQPAEERSYVPSARDATLKGKRIGWLADLGGHLPMEPGILECCESALKTMQSAGAQVEPLALGFDAARLWDAWLVWRRALVAPAVAGVIAMPDTRQHIKPAALWEYDQAQGLLFNEFMRAAVTRSEFHTHLCTLFERFDLLALPVAQVWPFDITLDWPKAIAGRTMDTYHRWMEVTLYATFAVLPAISVPAGFGGPGGGLPMGLQLIGAPRADRAVIAAAAGYEALIPELISRRPFEG